MLPEKTYGTGERIILSVEDDDASYLLLTMAFDEVGGDLQLYRVKDGKEALDFLQHRGRYENAPKPNLVLLNLNMPRLNGFDVLQAMKDDPAINDVPAVVFSSSSMDKDRAKCLALGARSFVTKPSDVDELLRVLRDICSLV